MEVEEFLGRLCCLRCPSCGVIGNLIRHGYIRWHSSPEKGGIRAWRIHCQKRRGQGGCGHAPSIRLGDCIPRRCFSAEQLWAFLRALSQARSVKAAWEQAGIPMSLDTGYRVYRRLLRCQSLLRTRLCARAPPPEATSAGTPILLTLAHLKQAFATKHPVSDYQVEFQQSFLAVA